MEFARIERIVMDPEQFNLRAAWAIVLAARAHVLANRDLEADKVLQKVSLKLARKFPKAKKSKYMLNWLVYAGPKRGSYAEVKVIKF